MKLKAYPFPFLHVRARYSSFIINAESEPVHDTWGYDAFWDCNDYIIWHKAMVVKYGKKYADERIVDAFSDDNVGLFGHEKFCSYDPTFIKYFTEQGFGDLVGTAGNIITNVAGIGENVSGAGKNLTSSAATTAKVLVYALPIMLTLFAAGVVYYGYSKYLKNVKAA